MHTPLITANDCEGAGDTFSIAPSPSPSPSPSSPSPSPSPTSTSTNPESEKVEQRHFFNRPAYLTVSSQLHLEAYSAELGDVWTLSPTFRAEESETPRHLSEFYMLEAEFRSITSLDKLMQEVEDLITPVSVNSVMDNHGRPDYLKKRLREMHQFIYIVKVGPECLVPSERHR